MRNLAALLLASSAFAALPASAVERGCKANIYIAKDGSTSWLDSFSATGTAVTANNAREEARARAIACVRAARDIRAEHREPDQCQPSASVDLFDLASMKVAIEESVCRHRRTNPGGTYQVRVQVFGDKGCSADELITGYTVTFSMCEKVGAWEVQTDRPGSDYRNFDYDGVDPGRCQSECEEDPQCKAWTFVGWIPNRPNYKGAQSERDPITRSHCWLKNAIPGQQWCNSCISGVKGIMGSTDLRGGDYKSVRLTSWDPATCKAICDRDFKCRAWTTVRAIKEDAFDRAVQVCWLKDRLPPPQWLTGARSGVK
jgi:hypothetical protein